MISPELLRRFSFSAGISPEKIVELAKIGKEISRSLFLSRRRES